MRFWGSERGILEAVIRQLCFVTRSGQVADLHLLELRRLTGVQIRAELLRRVKWD